MESLIIDFNCKPSKTERARMEERMASWRTVYSFIKDLDDTIGNLAEIQKMIEWEATNVRGPRAQILVRLHMRFNAMRQRLEFSKLIRHATR